MKALQKIIASIVLFGGGLLIGSVIISSANSLTTPNQPGSANDPLVTKSYVDEQIQAVLNGHDPSGEPAAPASGHEWEVVELRQGQSLITDIGTEMIVRNGKTVVISSAVNGIADVTSGVDLVDGDEIKTNHLLINPGEERGIRPAESVTGTIFVMVRGEYTITD